jgi:hypothetical protein
MSFLHQAGECKNTVAACLVHPNPQGPGCRPAERTRKRIHPWSFHPIRLRCHPWRRFRSLRLRCHSWRRVRPLRHCPGATGPQSPRLGRRSLRAPRATSPSVRFATFFHLSKVRCNIRTSLAPRRSQSFCPIVAGGSAPDCASHYVLSAQIAGTALPTAKRARLNTVGLVRVGPDTSRRRPRSQPERHSVTRQPRGSWVGCASPVLN